MLLLGIFVQTAFQHTHVVAVYVQVLRKAGSEGRDLLPLMELVRTEVLYQVQGTGGITGQQGYRGVTPVAVLI